MLRTTSEQIILCANYILLRHRNTAHDGERNGSRECASGSLDNRAHLARGVVMIIMIIMITNIRALCVQ